MAKTARRTTHRSTTGTKLYAVRDAQGRFKDIQTYKRAHRQASSGRRKRRSGAERKAPLRTANSPHSSPIERGDTTAAPIRVPV
jgi:hypothetical protein